MSSDDDRAAYCRDCGEECEPSGTSYWHVCPNHGKRRTRDILLADGGQMQLHRRRAWRFVLVWMVACTLAIVGAFIAMGVTT